MPKTAARNLQRRIGRLRNLARREPVEVIQAGRRAYAAHELPADLVRVVARSRMARRHAKLDRLLDED